MKILHCFADQGVESEVLQGYGTVYRVGLDPEDTNESIPIKANAKALPFKDDVAFDFGLFHPPCQPFSNASRGRNDDENLIPLARELAEKYCDEWVIENVPNAPLNDPVELAGGMFGSPLEFRRAFETSYHVPQPFDQARLDGGNGPFAEHHRDGSWKGASGLWRSAKGYSGDYDMRSLKREGIPRTYIEYLIRPLLE
jgi:hypothetical protein